jgi:protease I
MWGVSGKARELRKIAGRIEAACPVDLIFPKYKNINSTRHLMNKSLEGKKVAILATNGFEQSELEKPREALENAGAETHVVSPENRLIQGWDKDKFGDSVPVDVQLINADPNDYDALLLPGGVMNPDKLRIIPEAVEFVQAFFDSGKPVAAICHGPQMLIEAGVVAGRKMTSYPSIRTDLINAGANWVDEEVVTDHGLVTSRKPDDIPAFNEKMIEEFAEGVHA